MPQGTILQDISGLCCLGEQLFEMLVINRVSCIHPNIHLEYGFGTVYRTNSEQSRNLHSSTCFHGEILKISVRFQIRPVPPGLVRRGMAVKMYNINLCGVV